MNIFLGLGSNIGDRQFYLNSACNELETKVIKILKKSPVYETPAMYMQHGPDFLNMVIEVDSPFGPLGLLDTIKSIEIKLGRMTRTSRFKSREIDIDLLAMNQYVFNSVKLNIPHKRIIERKFVLQPWADITPDFVIPGFKKNVITLLQETSDTSTLVKIEDLETVF